jgi:hypothetical protein
MRSAWPGRRDGFARAGCVGIIQDGSPRMETALQHVEILPVLAFLATAKAGHIVRAAGPGGKARP